LFTVILDNIIAKPYDELFTKEKVSKLVFLYYKDSLLKETMYDNLTRLFIPREGGDGSGPPYFLDCEIRAVSYGLNIFI